MSVLSLPSWAEEIRSTYLRGEASVFLLHGNVFDVTPDEGELLPLVDYLSQVLLRKKDVVCHFNPAGKIKLLRREQKLTNLDELVGARSIGAGLSALERMLRTTDGVAVIIDYAEMVAPSGDVGLLGESEREAIVSLHRWSLDRRFENSDNVVVLIAEHLSEVSPKILSNPRIQAVQVPLPDKHERAAIIRLVEPEATPRDIELLASRSAGLRNIQIRGILAPGEDSAEDYAERYELIREVLAEAPDAARRASKLTKVTSGMNRDQVLGYLQAEGLDVAIHKSESTSRYEEVLGLLDQRKRELLEKETFGLVEFVRANHDFSAVGGMDLVKRELMKVARDIREGRTNRVPMGLLFTGPMGTGKTFLAEAFAKSSGLTAIKLKNFRSKWVGSTEANLEKILSVVKAMGNVLVLIDEGDRAFGSGSEGDGGTSSRVIARIKEFMSDTSNRGRVLFVLMTNRPDKLDIDIKRAGRLDRKIPFFYAQTAEEVEPILLAQTRRHSIKHTLSFPQDRDAVSARLVEFSNADIEQVTLTAADRAESLGEELGAGHIGQALDDYLPARDQAMLEYMELLAVFESSSRALLPARYHDMNVEQLQNRLRELKSRIG